MTFTAYGLLLMNLCLVLLHGIPIYKYITQCLDVSGLHFQQMLVAVNSKDLDSEVGITDANDDIAHAFMRRHIQQLLAQ
jgi:hypothetical protein